MQHYGLGVSSVGLRSKSRPAGALLCCCWLHAEALTEPNQAAVLQFLEMLHML